MDMEFGDEVRVVGEPGDIDSGGQCYTPCNTVPELRSLLPFDPCSFQDPHLVSITSLFSILTLTLDPVLRTPYT